MVLNGKWNRFTMQWGNKQIRNLFKERIKAYKRKKILHCKGKIQWEGNLEEMRSI